jgi:hypothetical protein
LDLAWVSESLGDLNIRFDEYPHKDAAAEQADLEPPMNLGYETVDELRNYDHTWLSGGLAAIDVLKFRSKPEISANKA